MLPDEGFRANNQTFTDRAGWSWRFTSEVGRHGSPDIMKLGVVQKLVCGGYAAFVRWRLAVPKFAAPQATERYEYGISEHFRPKEPSGEAATSGSYARAKGG